MYREFPFSSDYLGFVEKVKYQFNCFPLEVIFLLNVSYTRMSSISLPGESSFLVKRRGYR